MKKKKPKLKVIKIPGNCQGCHFWQAQDYNDEMCWLYNSKTVDEILDAIQRGAKDCDKTDICSWCKKAIYLDCAGRLSKAKQSLLKLAIDGLEKEIQAKPENESKGSNIMRCGRNFGIQASIQSLKSTFGGG